MLAPGGLAIHHAGVMGGYSEWAGTVSQESTST